MSVCPLHRGYYEFGTECPICKDKKLIALSVEYDKQDRVRVTMASQGDRFMPERSRAIMVFRKGEEK